MTNMTADTPELCEGCWKFPCNQCTNMTADTRPVPAWYANAALWCEACSPDGATPVNGSNETDTPSHCEGCGVPLECTLTPDGVTYVQDAIREGAGCCAELWPVLFAEYLDDKDNNDESAGS